MYLFCLYLSVKLHGKCYLNRERVLDVAMNDRSPRNFNDAPSLRVDSGYTAYIRCSLSNY